MSDVQDPTADPQDDADIPSADTVEARAEAGAAKAEVEGLKQELQELKERFARAQADFDNTRKRLRKEADEAGNRAIARSLRPVLNELDNLTRAVNAAKPEAFAEFATGVAMIRENLAGALAGCGLEPVSVEGVFDPAIHEVIADQERDDVPKGTIVAVHRAGYRLKDQLVRAAQVVVAKPKAGG